ncbi:phage baseplate assembly protein V [Sphingomonas sp.]|uniref:phage baseplate assembly protein V n=1 Tax=Sphingomonas sp. TaxID=28214 RepID=UPI00289D7716|nr:phage baseplate assembly protein V [Sphingomonas sp.]
MRDDNFLDLIGQMAGFGKIETVDLEAGLVTIRQGDVLTAPIRWIMGGGGNTKVWNRPKIGEQVLLIAPEGDIAGAIALRGVHSTAFPPIGDPDREVIQFEDGAIVAYHPDTHALALTLPAGGTITIDAQGGLTIKGPVTIEGPLDIKGTVTASDDVVAAGKSLKSHLHDKVQPGSGVSGKPL